MPRLATRPGSRPGSVVILALANALPHLLTKVGAAPAAWPGANLIRALAESEEPEVPPGSADFYYRLAFCAFLVLAGGLFAGLTLGLLSLDLVNLEVLQSAGEPRTQRHAAKVHKLLHRGRHWVLVTLLLANVVVNESLPIFLDSIAGGGVAAVVLSTAAIVVFGEVIPQSLCARWGLAIGARCSWFVFALMIVLSPIAWPIAKLLDYLLGEEHGTMYRRGELKTFVGLHKKNMINHGEGLEDTALNDDEVTIISSVLELSDKPISDLMTPVEKLYSLSADTILDKAKVDEILMRGHSRVPIYNPANSSDFVGMLIVKKLISYDPHECLRIDSFPLSILPETSPDVDCFQVLNYFQKGRSHMLLVSQTPGQCGGVVGVVTLEDVIEEIIAEEILDETDVFVSNQSNVRVVRETRKKIRASIAGIVERRKTRYLDHPSPPLSGADSPNPVVAAGLVPSVNPKRPVINHRHTKGPQARGATPVIPGTPIVEEPSESQPLLGKK